MPEIRFYHNAPDRLRVACSVTAKAWGQGRRISVLATDGAQARHFDQLLWSFQPLAFVPHVGAESPLAAETPVVIGTHLDALHHEDVLINLGGNAVKFTEQGEVVVRISGTPAGDDED